MEEYAAMRSETSPDHSLYSCNAGTDSSSTITRKRGETRYKHRGKELRALGYEMKCDDVTGSNRMGSRGSAVWCERRSHRYYELGPMMEGWV